MDRKKILLVILFVTVISAIIVFLAPKTAKAPTQIFTPLPTQEPILSRINPDRCQPFKDAKAEISCMDALKQALEAYPGEIYNVEFKEIAYRENKNAKIVSVSSWLVYIYPDTPIEIPAPSGKIKSIAVAVHPLTQAYISVYFEESL